MKVKEILEFTEEYLKKYSFSKPRLESEKIVASILGVERIGIFLMYEDEFTQTQKLKEILKEMSRTNKNFEELDKVENFTVRNKQIFKDAIEYLKKRGVPTPRHDVEHILARIWNIDKNMVTLSMNREIEDIDLLKDMLKSRGKRYPLQYILGEWDFYGRTFKLNQNVLIPRADTEILVEQALTILKEIPKPTICDIGTGSGAIAITLGLELPTSRVLGIDISLEALNLARQNGENLEAQNVKFIESNLFNILESEKYKKVKFDMIISNPPYISQNEYNELMPEVLNYEPKIALTDNGDGLSFYKEISQNSTKFLKTGGYLVFEIGHTQASDVCEIMKKNKFAIVGVIKDYGGKDRVVIGREEKSCQQN